MVSEYRKDLITSDLVVIAPGRAKRPEAFIFPPRIAETEEQIKNCFFCEGNESQTPPEIFALRNPGSKADGPGWRIRVVPNKFPTFGEAKKTIIKKVDLYEKITTPGVHEVIILHDHKKGLADLGIDGLKELLGALQERYLANKTNKEVSYILIIENYGQTSGASIHHPHLQLFGFSNFENSLIAKELDGARSYLAQFGTCPWCDIVNLERKKEIRIVAENKDFIAIVPFAARSPFEVQILPVQHSAFFENLSSSQKESLAEILKSVLTKIKKGLSDPDYNFYFHTAPTQCYQTEQGCVIPSYFHWHLSVLPHVTNFGGFEYATGMIVNVMLPEEAAQFLKHIN